MSRAVFKRTARPDALNARQASRTHIINSLQQFSDIPTGFFLSLSVCVYVCALVVNYNPHLKRLVYKRLISRNFPGIVSRGQMCARSLKVVPTGYFVVVCLFICWFG